MVQLYRRWLLQLLTGYLISSAVASPTSIWHVSIFQGPAPAPEDGPPLSASALRDSSYIPVQVGSIIGAYLLFVIATGIALVLVGRRLRRAAQASPRTLAMELLKPGQHHHSHTLGPSPISPATDNPYGPSPISTVDMKSSTWPSPDKTKAHSIWPSIGKRHQKQASVQSSVVTFDDGVIEDDRARNQQEMDRLYAAVMEHEEHKSTSRLDLVGPQYPPELQHLRSSGPATQQPSAQSPRLDTDSPARTATVSPRKQPRPSPITTQSRLSSRSSFGSFSKKRGIRNLPISPTAGVAGSGLGACQHLWRGRASEPKTVQAGSTPAHAARGSTRWHVGASKRVSDQSETGEIPRIGPHPAHSSTDGFEISGSECSARASVTSPREQHPVARSRQADRLPSRSASRNRETPTPGPIHFSAPRSLFGTLTPQTTPTDLLR